jgi:phenylacetate-CoA ligase
LNRGVSAIYNALPVGAQNLLCTVDGYRRHRQRFTKHFHEKLVLWEKTVNDTMEQHLERQWQSLKHMMLESRQRVPYYRFLPDPIECSDPGESIRRTLKEIPPLEKSVYRARSRDFLTPDVHRWQYSERYTSGTTGTALRIFDSAERFSENYAAVWRQRRSFGVDLSDPFLAFTGGVTTPLRRDQPPFWRQDIYSKRTLFSVYHMSPSNLEHYIDNLFAAPARYAEGYPSALHLMGRAMIDAGRCLEPGHLTAVFTSSESLLAFQRETIERAFGAPVRDHYASTEHIVSMTACRENMLHVDMEFGIVEVEPSEETDDWVRGPLIVTGLGHPAAPMIRYRIGDVGTKLKRACPCGREGDAFLDIDGRIEDYVLTPEGRLVGRMDHVFKGRFDIAEAQIIQTEKNRLQVLVIPGSEFDENSVINVRRAFHGLVGTAMQVDIQTVDEIPRERNGKFRAVKSTVARLEQ